MPCRGSGQVISNLGGTPSKITCPWCDGGGVRVPGIDAQARWPGEQQAPAPSGDAPSEAGEHGSGAVSENGAEASAEPPSAS
jgi:hypothetical protein